MNEVCIQSQEFLNSIFEGSFFDLHAHIVESASGCSLNIEGVDDSLLLNEGGELLEAVEHLLNQVFGRKLTRDERLVCDVRNYRATREAELQAMARYASEQVRKTGTEFTFAPMIANERRVIHMALAAEEDLHTESVGEGSARRLKVSLQSFIK
jgi:spoIIIJ-associated protein